MSAAAPQVNGSTAPAWRIVHADCRRALAAMPPASVHLALLSPPYWGLRAYEGARPSVWGGEPDCRHEWDEVPVSAQHYGSKGASSAVNGQVHVPRATAASALCRKCGAWRGCLGLEPSVALWARNTVEAIRHLKRVLRPDATLWVNIGHKWNCPPNGRRNDDPSRRAVDDRTFSADIPLGLAEDLGPKQLTLQPERLALGLQDDGWIIRSPIVWEKPNGKPDHRRDVPGGSHEMVYMLSLRASGYYYDRHAVRRQCRTDATKSGNLRDVWEIHAETGRCRHTAAFPLALAERVIELGTSEAGCCPTCGAPYRRKTIKLTPSRQSESTAEQREANRLAGRPGSSGCTVPRKSIGFGAQHKTVGWEPSCKCGLLSGPPVPCTVLDPFSGSGTTVLAAVLNGRSGIGIDVSRAYCERSRERIREALEERERSDRDAEVWRVPGCGGSRVRDGVLLGDRATDSR